MPAVTRKELTGLMNFLTVAGDCPATITGATLFTLMTQLGKGMRDSGQAYQSVCGDQGRMKAFLKSGYDELTSGLASPSHLAAIFDAHIALDKLDGRKLAEAYKKMQLDAVRDGINEASDKDKADAFTQRLVLKAIGVSLGRRLSGFDNRHSVALGDIDHSTFEVFYPKKEPLLQSAGTGKLEWNSWMRGMLAAKGNAIFDIEQAVALWGLSRSARADEASSLAVGLDARRPAFASALTASGDGDSDDDDEWSDDSDEEGAAAPAAVAPAIPPRDAPAAPPPGGFRGTAAAPSPGRGGGGGARRPPVAPPRPPAVSAAPTAASAAPPSAPPPAVSAIGERFREKFKKLHDQHKSVTRYFWRFLISRPFMASRDVLADRFFAVLNECSHAANYKGSDVSESFFCFFPDKPPEGGGAWDTRDAWVRNFALSDFTRTVVTKLGGDRAIFSKFMEFIVDEVVGDEAKLDIKKGCDMRALLNFMTVVVDNFGPFKEKANDVLLRLYNQVDTPHGDDKGKSAMVKSLAHKQEGGKDALLLLYSESTVDGVKANIVSLLLHEKEDGMNALLYLFNHMERKNDRKDLVRLLKRDDDGGVDRILFLFRKMDDQGKENLEKALKSLEKPKDDKSERVWGTLVSKAAEQTAGQSWWMMFRPSKGAETRDPAPGSGRKAEATAPSLPGS